ncbi:N-acetyltransferase, partial [Escherichia coli]|nr:N-acetyltransferase [Escherichia coli]MCO1625925.1 N-acetyltransferase [Escherichia coli]
GLLIEGFDTPPCAMMPHGKPWYAAHIEQLGYHKGIDLLAWWMQRTDLTFSPALKKLMDQVRKKVTIRCINRQRFAEEMQILREIFNSGWQHNWGFVPFTEHEFATMGDQLKYLVPDDMIYIAEIDSAPCAFIVGLPNINEAIADLNGSLFPFGWAKLLWRLKVSGVRTARVPLMGVRDEYQFSRIGPVIALLLIEALRDPFARRKIDALEMSWILETNTGMNNMLERIGAEPYKRYRLYEKQI